MNKKLINGVVLAAGLMLSASTISSYAATAPKTSAAPMVMSVNMQPVIGQIGEVTILHDTSLYKLDLIRN